MGKWSSFKEQQLLVENFREFVKEEEVAQASADSKSGGITAPDVFRQDLVQFVNSLNSNKEDIIKAVLSGLQDAAGEKDDRVKIIGTTVKCLNLRPTQNEVVFDKSVPFAVENPKVFMEYYNSNGPFKVGPPGNDAIITLNGKYILDGHHRWSSLYCVNPHASMYTFDLQTKIDPKNALKLLQASIRAFTKKRLPSNKGGGINLFGIDETTLAQALAKLVTPAVAAGLIKAGFLRTDKGRQQGTGVNPKAQGEKAARRAKEQEEKAARRAMGAEKGVNEAPEDGARLGGESNKDAAARGDSRTNTVYKRLLELYTKNISLMKARNRPVKGATPRPVMPQTDAPAGSKVSAGGSTPAALEPLEKGVIDFRSPFAVNEIKELAREELKKILGK